MYKIHLPPKPAIHYPDSDGKPMAESTLQAMWIMLLCGNLRWLFLDQNVFVGADLLWYPVEGQPGIRVAPDVLAVFGRPDGYRGSYKQWEEENIPLTVVFEIISPGNDAYELANKYAFYEEHGVEEYYLFDPAVKRLSIFLRKGEVFRAVRPVDGFVSPRLGIRFDLSGPEMVVYGPDGRPFLPMEGVQTARLAAEARLEQEHKARLAAEQRVTDIQKRTARLVELSRKVRQQQATTDELAELERLEQEPI